MRQERFIALGVMTQSQPHKPALHFVGFRDDRYWNAVRVWGKPDFVHITFDRYATHDMLPADTVVFAKGDWQQTPKSFGGPDVIED
jgi:hypothetical protein